MRNGDGWRDMFRRHRRRRWTRPQLLALLVIATVGLIVAVVIGWDNRNSRRDGAPSTPVPAAPVTSVDPCSVPHSEQGAATSAVEGLQAIKTAFLAATTPAQRDVILDRYVAPEKRGVVRSVIDQYPSSFTKVDTTPVAWLTLAYAPDRAVVRVSMTDTGTAADGTTQTGKGVSDVTLLWNAPLEQWRLLSWPTNPDSRYADELVAVGHTFCGAS